MNQKKKKILIVGGTGFIGYHLAKASLKKGWKVTSVSINKPKKIRRLKNIKYIFCDITKKTLLKKKIKKKYDYIVNLGGHVNHSNKLKTFKSHYLGCVNLTELFQEKPPFTFVQMGSSGEYGKINSPHNESSKCYPVSSYQKAKYLSSKYLTKISKSKNFPAVVLRLYQAYGPNQDLNRFIPIIVKNCLDKKKFPCSEGKQFRDFLYVSDVVNAIIKSLLIKKAKGHIFNIGTGKPRNIRKIIEYIRSVTGGGQPEFGKIKLRKDEAIKVYPKINKAWKKLGWKPKISFEKGIKNTIEYYVKKKTK